MQVDPMPVEGLTQKLKKDGRKTSCSSQLYFTMPAGTRRRKLYLEDLGQEGRCEECCMLDDNIITLVLIGNRKLVQKLIGWLTDLY